MNTPKHIGTFLILFFCSIFFRQTLVAQPGDLDEQSIDSVITWLNYNYTIDTTEYLRIGRRTLSRLDEASHDQKGEVFAALASWHGFHGKYGKDSVVYYDLKSLEQYKIQGDSLSVGSTYLLMSTDYLNIGNMEEALKATFSALPIFEALGQVNGVSKAYRSLANIYVVQNNFDDAIKYAKRAKEGLSETEEYYSICLSSMALINAYLGKEEYENAEREAAEALAIHAAHLPNDFGVKVRVLGAKSKASLGLNKLDQALAEAQETYNIVLPMNEKAAQSFRGGIGDVLMEKKQFKEAITEYLAVISYFDWDGIEYVEAPFSKLVTCYKEIGDYKNALIYKEKLTDVQLNLKNQEVENLESEAVIKYETGKKDQAIAAQEIEIAQKNKIQILGGIVLASLMGFLSLLFWSFRKNKKFTAELSVKNRENEFLVKEIHHRVKNNLQILSSLLSLQSHHITDEKAADAIKEGRNRVESMGLIHQRLYSGDEMTVINLNDYVDDLCEHLSESFILEEQNIEIRSDIEITKVDVETAIPLGLVINELITNSIKYAFEGRDSGLISVRIWQNQNQQMCLSVTDDGNGKSTINADPKRNSNFGSDLVKVLIKKLKGRLTESSENGWATMITFDRFKIVN